VVFEFGDNDRTHTEPGTYLSLPEFGPKGRVASSLPDRRPLQPIRCGRIGGCRYQILHNQRKDDLPGIELAWRYSLPYEPSCRPSPSLSTDPSYLNSVDGYTRGDRIYIGRYACPLLCSSKRTGLAADSNHTYCRFSIEKVP